MPRTTMTTFLADLRIPMECGCSLSYLTFRVRALAGRFASARRQRRSGVRCQTFGLTPALLFWPGARKALITIPLTRFGAGREWPAVMALTVGCPNPLGQTPPQVIGLN